MVAADSTTPGRLVPERQRIIGSTGSSHDNPPVLAARWPIFPRVYRLSRCIANGQPDASGQPAYAHFGLGSAQSVDVEVILPHGKGKLIRKGVAANQVTPRAGQLEGFPQRRDQVAAR
jgi:hypothetical protein